MMRLQFVRPRAARCDGQDSGVDGASAFNVVGRVADYQDLLTAQGRAQQLAPPLLSDSGDLVAVFVIIGEPAGLENFPELITANLDLRAKSDVTRQQTDGGRLRKRVQLTDEFPDAGEH